MKTAVFTICARNYLAYALALQTSVQRFEPDLPFFIYLADEPLDPGMAPHARIVPVDDLGLPDLTSMAFRYSVMEFSTAIKADCFLDLLLNQGFERAIYLDPDTCVFAPLAEVHQALAGGASLVLTPHILAPLPAGAVPSEADIMRSGIFNLGFAAFARTEESLRFLRWWARELHESCYSAPERDLFVDQRFVDMAPAFISELCLLRHPGYNVAYWNLAERRLSRSEGTTLVNGQALVLFHFSGVVPGKPEILSKHMGTHGVLAGPEVMDLVSGYLSALDEHGHDAWASIPYGFGFFRDGTPVLAPMRRGPSAAPMRNWPQAPDLEYWLCPDAAVDQEAGILLTRLMTGIYKLRPDLQAAFPLSSRTGRKAFHDWFVCDGVREYAIPEVLLPPSALSARRFSLIARFRRWTAVHLGR